MCTQPWGHTVCLKNVYLALGYTIGLKNAHSALDHMIGLKNVHSALKRRLTWENSKVCSHRYAKHFSKLRNVKTALEYLWQNKNNTSGLLLQWCLLVCVCLDTSPARPLSAIITVKSLLMDSSKYNKLVVLRPCLTSTMANTCQGRPLLIHQTPLNIMKFESKGKW